MSHYLFVSYANRVSINGIIYLHRISDTRIGGSTKRNIEMMKALCGEDAFSNVAIVTTMWPHDVGSDEHVKQNKREQQLKDIYLTDMATEGAQMIRHDQCQTLPERKAWAQAILWQLFENWKDDQVTLKIQHEMVDLTSTLENTSAGKILKQHMSESQVHIEKELCGAEQSLKHQGHSEHGSLPQGDLERDQDELYRMLESTKSQDALKGSLLEIHQKQEANFMNQMQTMEQKWIEALREKKNEYRAKEQQYQERQVIEQATRLNEREDQRHEHQTTSQVLAALEARHDQDRKRLAELTRVGSLQYEELQRRHREQRSESARFRQHESETRQELESMKAEFEKLKAETESNLDTASRAKSRWIGPVVQGGFGLGKQYVIRT